MKLTHPDAWHTFAGGTSAASDRHSYSAVLNCGEYRIWPVSSARNVERHIGYRAYFVNTHGATCGGLWQPLEHSLLLTLPQARRACRNHFERELPAGSVLIVPQSLSTQEA